MNIQRILFPTDFSVYNNAALDFASRLASESRAVLHILHVDDALDLNAALGDAGYLYGTAEDHRRDIEERLYRVKPTVAGVAYEHHYATGSPAAEILRLAEREDIDLIVMGSHGRTGLARLLMGSIAEAIMRRAKCPVLVVKPAIAAVEEESSVALAGARG